MCPVIATKRCLPLVQGIVTFMVNVTARALDPSKVSLLALLYLHNLINGTYIRPQYKYEESEKEFVKYNNMHTPSSMLVYLCPLLPN
jgi:hypothetical protein